MRKCPAPGCQHPREKHALTCMVHWQVLPLNAKLIFARLIAAGGALRARRLTRDVLRDAAA